jgi:flavodoxin
MISTLARGFHLLMVRDYSFAGPADMSLIKAASGKIATAERTRPQGGRMKTLVTYFSQTGKTQMVAEAIFDAITGEKEIRPFEEIESLDGYDLSFIGFPIIAFGPAPAGKEFLAEKARGKKIALFVTHAAPEHQEGLTEWLDRCREAASESQLLGMFDCMGELSEQIADFLMKSDDPMLRSFGERRGETLGQPDADRLQRARNFAKATLTKLNS